MRLLISLVWIVLCITLVIVSPGSIQAQPPLTPGWYENSGSAVIFEDASLKISWENSYVYPYSADAPLYWYAQVVYRNVGNQPTDIVCSAGFIDISPPREYMRGTANAGTVLAQQWFCEHQYTGYTITLAPGESLSQWAIFHNVPWPGGEVRLEWPPYGFSPWINPWQSPSENHLAPPECPPELVTRGECTPAAIPTQGLSEEELALLEGVPICTTDSGTESTLPAVGTVYRAIKIVASPESGTTIIAIMQNPEYPGHYLQLILHGKLTSVSAGGCLDLHSAASVGTHHEGYIPVIIPPDIRLPPASSTQPPEN
jgi:hypothetical protein